MNNKGKGRNKEVGSGSTTLPDLHRTDLKLSIKKNLRYLVDELRSREPLQHQLIAKTHSKHLTKRCPSQSISILYCTHKKIRKDPQISEVS
jgi:hypothetical protein